jgi:heme/copper-type cytochrome/quinol oxidase subunit 2
MATDGSTVAATATATAAPGGTEVTSVRCPSRPGRDGERLSYKEDFVQMPPRTAGARRVLRILAAALIVIVGTGILVVAQARRDFDVVARRYSFTVSGNDRAEIRVTQDDVVRVTFSSEDIPHSFTIEDHADSHYRIMRRAEAGKPVSFEFRADTVGRFRFYCSLTTDPKCKTMQGTLIVEPK